MISTHDRERKSFNLIPQSIPYLVLALLLLCGASSASAQSEQPKPTETARVEAPAGPDTKVAAGASDHQIQPTVEQQLKALQDRVSELEKLLSMQHAASVADTTDAASLKSAEKELLAGGTAPGLNVTKPVPQDASQAAPAPETKEISAQTTTKGEAFEGDWTWLNSGGHNSDSPMATKYFTPEFRADANYTLDYNHPKDDSLGGSTETFRSDEWQLEQVSIGGDIHIDNVRGRILTMNGLFATTTVRNDASPSRGQWDLANAYKYVSEAWGGYHWNVDHG